MFGRNYEEAQSCVLLAVNYTVTWRFADVYDRINNAFDDGCLHS